MKNTKPELHVTGVMTMADGRPMYLVNQPSADTLARTIKRVIDKKLLEAVKEKISCESE